MPTLQSGIKSAVQCLAWLECPVFKLLSHTSTKVAVFANASLHGHWRGSDRRCGLRGEGVGRHWILCGTFTCPSFDARHHEIDVAEHRIRVNETVHMTHNHAFERPKVLCGAASDRDMSSGGGRSMGL